MFSRRYLDRSVIIMAPRDNSKRNDDTNTDIGTTTSNDHDIIELTERDRSDRSCKSPLAAFEGCCLILASRIRRMEAATSE